jgi:hypothetical protein
MDRKGIYGKLWSRQELILALYLYCQIPFSHAHARNVEVKRLATILGRTPSAVARKLGNFGSFDPLLAAKGIKGLIHAGKGDQEVWEEYYGSWSNLVVDSNAALSELAFAPEAIEEVTDEGQEPVIAQPIGPTSEYRTIITRRFQSFFRRAVLSSYRSSCCICGLDLLNLLIASHILPWSEREESRTDPRNGLCLCALHDRAFDSGLVSVDTDLIIHLSHIITRSHNTRVRDFFFEYEGRQIEKPYRFSPDPVYLSWHFSNRFVA